MHKQKSSFLRLIESKDKKLAGPQQVRSPEPRALMVTQSSMTPLRMVQALAGVTEGRVTCSTWLPLPGQGVLVHLCLEYPFLVPTGSGQRGGGPGVQGGSG